MAGIAAAETGNGEGIAGVAPDAKVLAVKALDEDGGSFEDIGLGIRYAADHGAKVINLSLGALPGVQALTITGLIDDVREAIVYANGKDVVVVAAAGNESFPICDTPAFDPDVVCVAATDKREAHSFYSNFGIREDLIAVSAPGGSAIPICKEDVVSTVPGGEGTRSCEYPMEQTYDEYAGTSMATPHVAGVAALLAAQGRSRSLIIEALTKTARQPGTDVRGVYDPVYGYGIVDATAAVAYDPSGGTTTTTSTSTTTTSTSTTSTTSTSSDTIPPTAPIGLTAEGGRAKVTLSWNRSTDSGGSGLGGYEVFRATSSAGPFQQVATVTKTSYADNRLARSTTYWYYVKAFDSAGNRSAPSNTASATTT